MKHNQEVLYNKDAANFLREREAFWERSNQEKFSLLLEHLGRCQRLVDIGCGCGQFLHVAQDYVLEVWGVDESPHRLKDLGDVCPKAKVVMCRADRLDLPDQYFDVAVTSQMLHEVKLFGTDCELQTVLREIKRILVAGGRYLLLDHRDAGAGDVVVKLPTAKIKQLREFERKFQYYRATHHHIDDRVVNISKRALQDFLTKDWSLNSPMESMEMRETHNVFQKDKAIQFIESAGFLFHKWIPFSNIGEDLGRLKGELLEGEPWFRKFLLVAIKR